MGPREGGGSGKKLAAGVRLLLFHPEWSRSCDGCEKWLFDDSGPAPTGQRIKRFGLPVSRPKGTVTPCIRCPKIPEDAPAKSRRFAIEMTMRSRQAYLHYLECRAVGVWPNDPIVRRNARIIRLIEDEYGRRPLMNIVALLRILTSQ